MAALFPLVAVMQPAVTQQPSTQQISVNSKVVFSVIAPGATSYQWRKGSVPITDATASALVIFGATRDEAGDY